MKKSITKHLGILALAAAMSVLMNGCNSQPSREVTASCTVPQGHKLDESLIHVKGELARTPCHYDFGRYEMALLNIAKGSPGADNKQHFYDFYTWSVEQGVISKNQAKEQYTRYFSRSYGTSLPDNFSNCAMGKRKDQILSTLKREAKDKQVGLQEVLGDRDAWFDAKTRHDNLVFILETTDLVCEDQDNG